MWPQGSSDPVCGTFFSVFLPTEAGKWVRGGIFSQKISIFAAAKIEYMQIQELQTLYARHPQVRALARALGKSEVRQIRLSGLQASSSALVFASAAVVPVKASRSVLEGKSEGVSVVESEGTPQGKSDGALSVASQPLPPLLFILDDQEEAGYFYGSLQGFLLCSLAGE